MELSSSFGICVINIPTACTKVSTVPINHCVRNMNLDITKTVSQVVLKKIMKISFGGGGGLLRRHLQLVFLATSTSSEAPLLPFSC